MRISKRSNIASIAHAGISTLFGITCNTTSIGISTVVCRCKGTYTIDSVHSGIVVRIANSATYSISYKTTSIDFDIRLWRIHKASTLPHCITIIDCSRGRIAHQNTKIHCFGLSCSYLRFDKKILDSSTICITEQAHIGCRTGAYSPDFVLPTIKYPTETICSTTTNGCPNIVRSHLNVVRQLKVFAAITVATVHLVGQIGQMFAIFDQIWIGCRTRALCPSSNIACPIYSFRPRAYSHTQRHGQRKQALACIYK